VKRLAAIALLLVLPACGGAAAARTHSTASSTTSTTVASQPSHPSKAELGKQYLKIVAPYNAAVDTYNLKIKKARSYKAIRAVLRPLVSKEITFAHKILAMDFPKGMANDVKELVAASDAEAALNDTAARTNYGLISSTDQMTPVQARAQAAADIVRHDLGLSHS
jgi:hypothetical protein